MNTMTKMFILSLAMILLQSCLNPQLASLEEVEVIEAPSTPLDELAETEVIEEEEAPPEEEEEVLDPAIVTELEEIGNTYISYMDIDFNFVFPPAFEISQLDPTDSYCQDLLNGGGVGNCDTSFIVASGAQTDYLVEFIYQNYQRRDLDFPIQGLSRYVELALTTIVMNSNVTTANYQTAKLVEDGEAPFCDSVGGLQEFYFDNDFGPPPAFNGAGDYRIFNQAYSYTEAQRTEIIDAFDALSGVDITSIQTWAMNRGLMMDSAQANPCP